MSVVDEEATKIVAETTEAGMNVATAPDGSDTTDFMDAMSVNEALDVAQAGLAAAVACDPSLPAEFERPTASESHTPTARADDTTVPIDRAHVEAACRVVATAVGHAAGHFGLRAVCSRA